MLFYLSFIAAVFCPGVTFGTGNQSYLSVYFEVEEKLVMNKGGFSWKRLLGISGMKSKISRKTGIPMTKSGVERKIGAMVIDLIFGKKK